MDDSIQKIDYNLLLMNHLNRISCVTTSSFIDSVPKSEMRKYDDDGRPPNEIGDTALRWSVKFLYAIIPKDMFDDEANKEFEEFRKYAVKDYKNGKFPIYFQFDKIRVVINLLHRKGLLLSKQTIGMRNKTIKPEQIKEEWEN